MNFVKINEIPSFTGEMNRVRNHKTCNFVQNKPKCLWPLQIWIKCNKLIEYKHTQMLVKSKKNNFNADTCFPGGAFLWTEDTWAVEELTILTEVGMGRSGWPIPD